MYEKRDKDGSKNEQVQMWSSSACVWTTLQRPRSAGKAVCACVCPD